MISAGQHDEIGELTRLEGAEIALRVRGVGGANREGAQRLVARQALVRRPAAGGLCHLGPGG